MRQGIRFVYFSAFLVPALFAATAPSNAQSLTDALAGPASRAEAAGSWTTITRPSTSSAPTFDHWQAKIILAKPSLKAFQKVATTADPMHGLASYYATGERTATGETFDPNGLTAAHRTLPFGTHVRVTRIDTGDSVVVRINDRGPFKPGRVIDLSQRAAEDLRMTDSGLTAVKLEVVDRQGPQQSAENIPQRSLPR